MSSSSLMGEKAARPRSLKFDLRVKVDKCVCMCLMAVSAMCLMCLMSHVLHVCLCVSEEGSVNAHTDTPLFGRWALTVLSCPAVALV